MSNIDIFTESRYPVDRKRIRKTIADCLLANGVSGGVDLSISIVGERKMSTLHKKYLKSADTTDVLSFPLEGIDFPDNLLHLGDIVVCFPIAVRQAGENNRLVDEEIDFLVDHGCKHLLGIHHD